MSTSGVGEGPIAPMMATKDGVAKLRSLGYLGNAPAPTAKDAPAPETEESSKTESKEKSQTTAKEKSKSGPNPGLRTGTPTDPLQCHRL